MLVGIMSDSHDDMHQLSKVVELFNVHGVGRVLHAGDIVSPFAFELLCNLKAPFTGIFGNNDGDRVLLREKSGGNMHVQPLMLDVGGRRVVMVHEPASVEALARSGLYDLVIYGHLHVPAERRVGHALVLNPGKVARLHKGESTAMILDTDGMSVELVTLEGQTSNK